LNPHLLPALPFWERAAWLEVGAPGEPGASLLAFTHELDRGMYDHVKKKHTRS
jgi:hypothetical protein